MPLYIIIHNECLQRMCKTNWSRALFSPKCHFQKRLRFSTKVDDSQVRIFLEQRGACAIYTVHIGLLIYETYKQKRHRLRVQPDVRTEGGILLSPLNGNNRLKGHSFR